MTSRLPARATATAARIRSSPPLLALAIGGVLVLGLALGLAVGRLLTPSSVTEGPTEGREDDPGGFAAWLLGDEDEQDVVGRYLSAEQEIRAQLAKQALLEQQGDDRARVLRGLGAAAQPWTWLGPRNFGGRTRAFVVDPRDSKVMLAGGITGGVWRSADAGRSWTPLTDTFSNISINVLEMDPANPSVVYAGTGEAYYRSWPRHRGNGIMKSTDGGISWSFLESTTRNDAFDWVGDIEVSHNDPQRVYAATGTGVWLSRDGGQTWGTGPVHSTGDDPDSVGCMELAIRTDLEPDVVFASCGHEQFPIGVYRTTDGGQAWEQILPIDGQEIGFAALAIAPKNEDVIYASASRVVRKRGDVASAQGLYVSTRGGAPGSWELRADPANGGPNWLANCRYPTSGQGGYDNTIAVDPTDPNRLWVGGIDLFRSSDGGRTLELASDWILPPVDGTPYAHADQHAIVFDPGYDGATNRTVYFANDGGLYRTDDDRATLTASACKGRTETVVAGIAYQSMNNAYGIAQFVGGSVSDDGRYVIGGTQDNGTFFLDTQGATDWVSIWGADGGQSAMHPAGDWFVATTYDGSFYRLTGSARFGQSPRCLAWDFNDECTSVGPAKLDEFDFYPPLERDAGNALWTAGTKIWRSPDVGATWLEVGSLGGRTASAIALSPGDPNLAYVGTYGGTVFKTTNAADAAPTWAPLDTAFAAKVSSIAIDPRDPSTVFVAIKSFEGQQLWRSLQGGPFEPIDGTLPDTPVNAVAVNPLNGDMVYAGTDVGVFESLDRGVTWRVANENLATTIVSRLVFRAGTSELYAFTFGRGAYRVDVGTQSPPTNDLVSAPKDVALAPAFTDAIDIRSASSAPDDPALSCGSALSPTETRSVWYRLVATDGGPVAVTTDGSNFDTVLGVFEQAKGTLRELACNDDGVVALGPSSLVFDAAAGTTYLIEVARSARSPAGTLANNLRLSVSRP